jgi:hypothetical protein
MTHMGRPNVIANVFRCPSSVRSLTVTGNRFGRAESDYRRPVTELGLPVTELDRLSMIMDTMMPGG